MTGSHRTSPPSRGRLLLEAAGLSAAVIGTLQLLHRHVGEVHPLPPVLHWVRDAALALPLALLAVLVAAAVARRTSGPGRPAVTGALAGGAVFGLLSVPAGQVHELLFVAEHAHGSSFLSHSAADGLSAWLLAAGALLALRATAGLRLRVPSLRKPVVVALATSLVVPAGWAASATPAAAATAPACQVTRSYDVAVIDLDIPYNRWGTDAASGATNLDADGVMYVLQQDKAAVKNWDVPLNHVRAADGSYEPGADPAGGRRLRPRPLVLRANEGDCVKVTLKNELTGPQFGGQLTDPRTSLHVHGAEYDVQTADGSKVGFNDDTTLGIGETRVYNLKAPGKEGSYLFHDHGAPAGSEADGGLTVHGAFGALAVEPAGSRWYDPVSGAELSTPTPYTAVAGQSGELYIDAMIKPGTGAAFRESNQISHDEIPGIGFGFNYGAEPDSNRARFQCPDCVGEETSLSSWMYGDPGMVKLASGKGPHKPATGAVQDPRNWLPGKTAAELEDCGLPVSCWTSNVTHAYPNDPTKIRYGLAGVKETHVFHMHAHQWLMEPADNAANPESGMPQSITVDSQTFGPGDMFTADLIGGAGSKPGTVGDSIFHCHLYPHFAEGFWGLFRVHDVYENGTGTLPDGVEVNELKGLPDRAAKTPGLPDADAGRPGFPRFIPGQVGWRAPQPPGGTIAEANGQADDTATLAREDLRNASRMVAGRTLDPAVLDAPQTVTSTSAGTAEVQEISSPATGGSFTVASGAAVTAELPWDVSGADLTAALQLAGIQAQADQPDPAVRRWVLAFSGTQDVEPLVVDSTALVEGPAVVTTTTEGGAGGFTLTFGGQTTPLLSSSASAQQVQDALVALTTVDTATVTGSGPWTAKVTPAGQVDSLVLGASGATVDAGPLLGTDDASRAGAAQLAHQLLVEQRALKAAHDAKGTSIKPGAPLVDPCPTGTGAKREVTYNVSVLQRDLVYNEDGWHDTQGRIYVLDKDVPDVLAGRKEPEPLFIRVNAGDCINFNLTSYLPNWVGGDAFIELAQTNMVGGHIHLVKFDVNGSDGASNGWNYQQAAFSKAQADFNADLAAGRKACNPTPGGCLLPKPATWDPSTQSQLGVDRGQTIRERWYADSELRTVFTHDHHFPALVQNRGQYGALVVEPKNTQMRNPFTGATYRPGTGCTAPDAPAAGGCNGDAFGTMMDIIGPGTNDDFREFGLSFQDFVSLTKAGGDPASASDTFNPPAHPEHYPNEDPGVMGINYKNAPFLLRDTKNGAPVDPAYRFSSTVFGDPKTPLLQAYSGDKVRVRLVQGSQEEQHVWALHGMRWREEPDDPQSPLVNSKALGVSDAPNFEIPPLPCGVDEECRGDYLYSSTSTDATYLGTWGIFRVYGKKHGGLLPLPDNSNVQSTNGSIAQNVTGTAPPMVPPGKKGGDICPETGAKRFEVFATDGRINYNAQGDHDPYGLMYGVLQPGETPEQAVARVRREQQPMVLRANEGDCIEVNLTNRIDPNGAFATQHAQAGAADTPNGGDPSLILEPEDGTRAGLRVSLHPQVLRYDVRYSDGATVGFNRDQTVGPGQSIVYRWWADDVTPGEIGATNLVDFGDVRGHRHHGLFAGLVVEPKGSTYTDPISGAAVSSGAQADIRVPGAKDFRENVPFFQDGLNLRDAAGRPVDLPVHPGAAGPEPLDAEDEGEKALNYRSPRFAHRGDPLHELPGATPGPIDGRSLADVFDSTQHGDPDTPVFRAYAGDPVRQRVLQGSDKPRQHSWQLSGHAWKTQAEDPGSSLTGTTGGISVSRAVNVHIDKAGGVHGAAGDYRYGCGVAFHHLSGGLWGIERVYDAPGAGHFTPTALGTGQDPATADNPRRAGYSPLQPLEQRTVSGHVFDDSNRNRLRGGDERALADVAVELHAANADGTPGALLETRRTDANGRVAFTVNPTTPAYDLVLPDRADWATTTPKAMRVGVAKDGVEQVADFGQVQLANVAVRPYNDADGSATYSAGEPATEGWTVTLTGEGRTSSAPVAGGVAGFGDLLPGSYTASVTAGAGYYSTTHKTPITVAVAENADLTGEKELRSGFALKAGVSVQVFNDSNGNGTQEAGESSLSGRKLDAKGGPEGAVTTTATTDAAGAAVLDDPDPAIEGLVPGGYDVTQTLPADWSLTRATRKVTKADGTSAGEEALTVNGSSVRTGVQEKTSQLVVLRNHTTKGWISAQPFNDLNNDGVRQDKEGKLVGWRAFLYDAAGVLKGETTTDNGGKATWYVDRTAGVGQAPANYTVKMAPQEVPAGEVGWTATTPGSAVVAGISGEDRTASFGFVQLGSIQAFVWHDLDKDGVVDDVPGEPLADRTVRLYDATGRTLQLQKVSRTDGYATFPAAVGVDYQIEVLTPTGWTATAPFSVSGAVVTKTKVTGPTARQSVTVNFGHYNTSDRTPPVKPTATAATAANGTRTVTLTSETGATFRYTLDGSTPSASWGMRYTGPITIGTSKELKAVALDAAGNASEVGAWTYTIAGTTSAPTSPGTWTKITGGTRGVLTDLQAKDDGTRYYTTAVLSGTTATTDGYGTVVIPSGQRAVTGLGIRLEHRASIEGVTGSLEMYNWATRKYEIVRAAEAVPTSDVVTVVDVSGDQKRFVNQTTGEVRFKVRGTASKAFEFGIDQMQAVWRY